jgi:serine/threonine-protein kinase
MRAKVASSAPSSPTDPAAVEPQQELGAGSVLAERYRIEEAIGSGSRSQVYAAEQIGLQKKVAVKVMQAEHAHSAALIARFEREALAAAGIEHPNIAGAVDSGTLADGAPFFVLEYLSGRTLREELRSGGLSLERSLHVAKQVASALADAHELGIVHRDLKPENVMLLQRGDDADFVKVMDFGTALPTSRANATAEPNGTGELSFGTPGYMPPEQALGQPLDRRADLYSLGGILFEMLAGVPAFESGAGILAKQLAGHVPSFAERAPGLRLPPELERIVRRLLAADVAERFASADDFLEALETLTSNSAPPPAVSVSEKPPAAVPRSSAPPPFKRLQSGAPPAATPARRSATPAASAYGDDSNVPTTLNLPKVPAPSAPPQGPSVPAVTAPPPKAGAPLGRAAASAAFAGLAGAVRGRSADFSGRARVSFRTLRSRLGPRRERLLVGAMLAGGLGLAILLVSLPSTTTDGASSTDAVARGHAASASARSASAISAPSLVADQRPTRVAQARARSSAPTDEAALFLTLASDYAGSNRHVEAVALVGRMLVRQPELKDDERVASVLSRTARGDSDHASDESFALLTGPMGEKGAELVYALAVDSTTRAGVRRRAEAWLSSKDFDRVSSSALYSAVKLRNAKTCDQKHALLSLAGDVGGKQTLDVLRDLEARTICGPSDLKNCYPCLAADSRLKDSILRVEKRLSP